MRYKRTYPQNRNRLRGTENRLEAAKPGGCGVGEEGAGVWGSQMQTITFRVDKQQGLGFPGGSVGKNPPTMWETRV